VDDTCVTLANIAERFRAGAVDNIGGEEYHDIKRLSDLILAACAKDDRLVEYVESEPFTTKDKKVSLARAREELAHLPRVPLEAGIPLTVEWMRKVYNL
jgi:dTDP-glucose 4,6-dehydratase